jgi:pentatricopeptide repeat protein
MCSVAALEEGRAAHEQIIHSRWDSDVYLGSSLVDMYAKCGSMEDACRVFNKMPLCDAVTWNVMISGLVKCGQGQTVLGLFQQMQQEGVQPDPVTLVGVLNACAKCGSMEDACRVFNQMPSHDVVIWNVMIFGHMKCGQGQKALELFQQIQQEGVEPDSVTLLGVLNACTSIAALEEGRCAHEQIVERGWDSDVFIGNCLVDMYVKCGSMEDASRVFNKIPSHNVVTWNMMLFGHVKCGEREKALEPFQQMQQEGVQPDCHFCGGAECMCKCSYT